MSPNPNPITQRKADHLRLALNQQEVLTATSSFEAVRLVHQSLAPLAQSEVDLSTRWAGHQHAYPFYINAMTGGSNQTQVYNQQLAILARETGLALASGSVSAALQDSSVADSYRIMRQENPKGFILANLGAHHSVDNALRVVDLLEADALQIHLNRPQEAIMAEGDRDYRQWLRQIERLVQALDCPLVVKEVGFGMTHQTLRLLAECGVTTVDVSGRGGTNFIQIEDERQTTPRFQAAYGYGQTTAESLLEALLAPIELEILASGGIQDPFDIIKAQALGAQAVGVAGHFLHLLDQQGLEVTIDQVKRWQDQLVQLYLTVGVRNRSELQATDVLLTGDLRNWALDRGIPFQALATRHT